MNYSLKMLITGFMDEIAPHKYKTTYLNNRIYIHEVVKDIFYNISIFCDIVGGRKFYYISYDMKKSPIKNEEFKTVLELLTRLKEIH